MKSTHHTAANRPEYVTPAELRQRWKVSAMFLWRKRRKGELTAYRFGERGVRFSMSEIERIEANSATHA